MKLTTVFIMVFLLHVSAKSFSQITLNERNEPLENVLNSIKGQTGYSFFYDAADIKNLRVSIRVSNTTLDQVLSICFQDLPVEFKVVEKNVVLKKKEESFISKLKDLISLPIDIRGVVSGDQGPLSGVTIRLKDSNHLATVSNDKGEFYLSGLKENDILVFSFVGYKTQEVIVKSGNPLTIALEHDISGLEQVVVVGYGTTKRKDLTGSVSTVIAADIEDVPYNTVDNALAGKAAGVQVTKTDGTPGGAVRIRIRGSSSLLGGNDPLYVIDGVPFQVQSNFIAPGFGISSPVGSDVTGATTSINSGLSTSFINGLNSLGGLNPDDIESISILKDASSTAIYGSKAANGVVIITTKRGKKGMDPIITGSYYTTVTSPKLPNLLDASQYKSILTEAAQNSFNGRSMVAGYRIPTDVTQILNSPSSFFGNANTNWLHEVTRTTVSHNTEASVQGGGSSSRYFSSISYNNTPGVVRGTDFQRVSGKINLENEISPRFKFITNIIIGYTKQNIGDGAYGEAMRARPDISPYNANGVFTNFSAYSPGLLNPVALLTATNLSKTFSLLGSVSAVYDLSKSLEFKSSVSLNMQDYNQRNYTPSYVQLGGFLSNIANPGGIGSESYSRLANWFVENTLTYKKTFGRHSLDVVAGTSYETIKNSFFSATGSGYPNDNVLNSLSSATTPLIVKGDDPTMPQSYLLSFYLRANYTFEDKYLLTFTGRSDGSSKFGPDNKFGYFPSGGIGWRLSQEGFLKKISWIDEIKLRASYGLTGNQNIGNQMYRTLFSSVSYAGAPGLLPTQLGNAGIKWETTRQSDAGVDLSFFNGRLSAVFDYYDKRSSGVLLSLPVAPNTAYSSLLSNAAGIKNSGYEIALNGDIIRSKDFKWTASVNVTFNKSLVTQLNPEASLSQIGNLTGLEFNNSTLVQGKPLGLLTGLTVTGIIRTPAQLAAYKKQLGPYTFIFPFLNVGDAMYQLDGTGALKYPTIIGEAAPKYFGGIAQDFTYKRFNLNFYFTFSEGGKLLWGDHINSVKLESGTNATTAILGRYYSGNTNATDPRVLLDGDDGLYYKSNLDMFSSSYLKLRTLTLNYRLDNSKWMKSAGLKNVSIFGSATNVFTITKYPGNDPETSDDPYSVSGGYLDVSNYPSVRTFSLGIKATF